MIINIEDIDIIQVKDKVVQAMLICMFTDAKVPADEMPAGVEGNCGCWIDETEFVINDCRQKINLGSKAWVLPQCRMTDETPDAAVAYYEESLQPLVTAGILTDLQIAAAREQNRLNLMVQYNHKTLKILGA